MIHTPLNLTCNRFIRDQYQTYIQNITFVYMIKDLTARLTVRSWLPDSSLLVAALSLLIISCIDLNIKSFIICDKMYYANMCNLLRLLLGECKLVLIPTIIIFNIYCLLTMHRACIFCMLSEKNESKHISTIEFMIWFI